MITLTGVQTAPDAWQFTVAGLDPVESPTFTISYGDSTAPVVVTTHASGTTVVTHTYTTPGHHDYTVTVTAAKTAYATTLLALSTKLDGPVETLNTLSYTGGPVVDTLELGYRFRVNIPGYVSALFFWRNDGDALTSHKMNLWRHPDGTRVATATTTGETGSGRQRVPLAAPVYLAVGEYIVSYGVINSYWGYISPTPPMASASLTGIESRFNPGAPDIFPTNLVGSYQYLDVEFRAASTLAQLAADPLIPTLAHIPATTQTAAGLAVTVDVGPATIWATVIPGSPVPVVQVDTYIGNIGNVATWSVARDQPGDSAPIFIGSRLSEAVSFIDELAPLGVPITYRLIITYLDGSAVAVSSNTVMITGTAGCYLSNPATGAVLRVTLASWPDRARAARRALLSVLGRADPVALSDVHATPAGRWTLYTTSDADTVALVALLTAGAIVVLRTQPGSSIVSCTASVGDVTETRYSAFGGDQRRWVKVEIQEIEPLPATALPLPATLGGLADLGATLADLNALRATLLQLSMIPTDEGAPVAANV
jgi:hypothetical protein